MASHETPSRLEDLLLADAPGSDGAPHGRISRPARATLGAVAALTVIVLPFCRTDVGRQPAFLPAVVAAVLLVDVISAYMLGTRFRDTGDARLLVMALAYVWSVVLVVGYALAFPGLISERPPLASWPSAAPYLYLAWHIGFPVLLGVAWGYPGRWAGLIEDHRRRRISLGAFWACAAGAALVVAFVALAGHRFLPPLIIETDTFRLARLGGPPGMILALAVAAAVVTSRVRSRRGPERWAMVAAWVYVADLVLTFLSGQRYSLGWFVGRGLTVLGSSLVFMAMLGEFTALQRRLIRERGRLTHQTRTDDLTGLANRYALRVHLTERLDGPAGGWLMLLDLDRFKAVNDSFGHEAGDAVIVEAARRLTALCGGQMVARLGGDEFAVVFDADVSAGDLDRTAAATLTEISRPYELLVAGARARVFVGASIGLTELGSHRSASDVLRESDVALYRAKDAGRGRIATYDRELQVQALARLQLETTIRTALDGGEFLPYLQPIVALADGTTRGFELLLRLRGADGRDTLPPELIEVAEETGLIVAIDARMLLAAARLIAEDGAGTLGQLCVNMSASTLIHPGLPEILAALRATGVPTGRLAVEITERVLLDDGNGAGAAVASLRAAGLRVGLDDFGTGYSALAYLRRYPLDFLKIDRSFVADLDGRPGPAAIFQAVMAVAGALELEVIAEGVETAGQQAVLGQLGCTLAQGYHLGRPAAIETWVPGHRDVRLRPDPPAGDHLASLQPPADRRAVRSAPCAA